MRLPLPALLAIALGVPAAKAAPQLVEVELMCPIVEVVPVPGGLPELVVERGESQGLVVGARGVIYEGAEKSGIKDVVARAEVASVEKGRARVRLLPGPGLRVEAIRPGGQAALRALVPADVHRGLLFELYLIGVVFLDNYKEPIVDPQALLTATTSAVEDAALAKMVECLREVVEFCTDLKVPINRGKWKGRLVGDVMAEGGPDDLRAFFRFVRDYPGKYIGKPWKVSETMATWALNNCPPSQEDRLAELLALKDDKALRADVLTIEEKDRQLLFEDIRDRADGPDGARYLALLERISRAQGKLTPVLLGPLEEARAKQLLLSPKKRADSARAYQRAAEAFFKVGTPLAIIEAVVCLNNVANAWFSAEKYDEALKATELARLAAVREAARTTDVQAAAHLPKSEVYAVQLAAKIADKRGDLGKIVEILTPMVGRYTGAGYSGGRESEIDLELLLARAHRRRGHVAEATRLYEQCQTLAGELGDTERQSKIAYDVGEMHFAASRYETALEAYDQSAVRARRAGKRDQEAKALSAAGQSLWNLGRLPEALARHDAGMALREALGDKSGIAWQLIQTGRIRRQIGDRATARQQLERAVAIETELGERSTVAEVQRELGDLFYDLGEPDACEKAFDAARATAVALGLPQGEGMAVRGMAQAAGLRRDYARAVERARQALGIHEKLGDRGEITQDLIWLASFLDEAGDRAGSDTTYRRLLDQADDDGMRAYAYSGLGSNALSDGRLDEAAKSAAEALVLAERLKDAKRRANAHALRGRILSRRGLYDEALAEHEKGLALAREVGDRPGLVDFLQHKAWLLNDLGRLAEARQAAEEALPIAEKNADPVEKAWTYNTLANIAESYGDLREELRLYNAGIPLMHDAGARYGEAALTFNRALRFIQLRDLDQALTDIDRADALARGNSTAELDVAILATRGEVLGLREQFDEAERAETQALDMARTRNPARVSEILTLLARVRSKRGDVAGALAAAGEAVTIEAVRSGKPYKALAELGKTQAIAKRDADAQATLLDVVARAEQRGGDVPWESLYWLGVVHARGGRTDAAIAALTRAVEASEKAEALLQGDRAKALYRADKMDAYMLLVKLLLARGREIDALRVLERAKHGELAELERRGAPPDAEAAVGVELEVREAKLAEKLEAERTAAAPDGERVRLLEVSLEGVRRRRADFVEEMSREHGESYDRYAVAPLELEKLQEHLPDGMLVISPVLLGDRVVTFAVSRSVFTHVEAKVGPGEVERLTDALLAETDLKHLRVRSVERNKQPPQGASPDLGASLERFKGPARRLYDVLIRPVLAATGAPRVLAVSAAGGLRYLPFSALLDGDVWLGDRVAIVRVTSLDREKFSKPAALKPISTVLALADPDGTLDGARTEVEAIRQVVPAATVLIGAEATRAALRSKAASFDVLHLATHGLLNAARPELSSILLADGSLLYPDIPALDLRSARLVVLSACETAARARGSGLEIAGLAYQFERTKAQSVIATLWPVHDEATAELMKELYVGLVAGRPLVDALAEAQRTLRKTRPHPVFWAPFVLLGSP